MRFVHILFVGLVMITFSCQKQTFTPYSEEVVVPTWEATPSNARGTQDVPGGGGVIDTGNPDPPTDGITDPNNDPDGDKTTKGGKF